MNKTRYIICEYQIRGQMEIGARISEEEFFCEQEAKMRADEWYSKQQGRRAVCVLEVKTTMKMVTKIQPPFP